RSRPAAWCRKRSAVVRRAGLRKNLAGPADVAPREVLPPIQRVKQRQHQRPREGKHTPPQKQRAPEKQQRGLQAPREQPEESPNRPDLNRNEPGLLQQMLSSITRVAKIIVGLLMLLPFMRHD